MSETAVIKKESAENGASAPVRLAVFIMFFASGVSGLIYEVVWSRQMTYLFGATLFAVATVLSAFMGGLALGSFLFGKYADRYENNLKLYAWLQVGVGVSALLIPVLIRIMDPIYAAVYRAEPSFFVLSVLRFILAFIVLLILTTMMGGTLPALSRFLVRRKNSLGLNVGALYSLNTLGAVLGCFLAGFFFIATLGVHGSTYLAVGINLVVAAVSFILARNAGANPIGKQAAQKDVKVEEPIDEQKAARDRKVLLAVLVTYGISGFIALSYQVVWSRALVFTFEAMKNTTYSFTAMLTVFLVGLAAGGAVMSAFIDKQKDPVRLYALIQLLIGLSAAFSFYVIFYIGPTFEPFALRDAAGNVNWTTGVLNVFAKTVAAIFVPTFLMGMAFPVATKVCVDRIKSVGFGVGRLYSVNTLGAIIGAFAAGFILIPVLGVAGTIFLLAVGNAALALYIFAINPLLNSKSRITAAVVCAVVAIVLFARTPSDVRFQELSDTERFIFYKEGPLATVSVVENSFEYRTLYVDNVGVAGTDRILLTDQKSLAHVPMLLLENPKSALTVGFGSGGASYSYTRYDSIDDIHCVEITKTVMDAAPDLLASNRGVLWPESRPKAVMPRAPQEYEHSAYPGYRTFDPRYDIVLDDVRSYLRFTGRKYDIIATDCTDLRYKSNANLYDYEYFKLCREHLTEDGMVVVWMPLAGLSDEMFRLALRTFYDVFPQMSIWYMNNESTHYILMLGTPKPLKIDYAMVKEKLKEKDVSSDLAELFLDDPDKILSCFICDQTTLDEFLEGEKINTEDHPYLEFESPKYGYGDQPMIDNLDSLMDIRTSVLSYVENVPDREAFEKRMERFAGGVPHIVKGHAHYRGLRMERACAQYMKAVEICPQDEATRYLLDFDELKLRVKARPFDPWAYRELGAVFYMQERYGDAVTYLSLLLERASEPPEGADAKTRAFYESCVSFAEKTIGLSYLKAGKPKKALPYLERALELSPDDEEVKSVMENL